MTTWPATLPQRFRVEGFTDALPNNVIVSQMESGPPKRRRRTTANIRKISGEMVMSTSQWDDLKTFFQTTVAEVLAFDFPEPGNEVSGTLSAIFTAPPQRTAFAPGYWKVSLGLEVQP